jgi:SPP1 gp7 family putative phage head morphogenesis protein
MPKLTLSKKREIWAKARKNVIFKGSPLRANEGILDYYVVKNIKAVKLIIKQSDNIIKDLFKGLAKDETIPPSLGSQIRIRYNAIDLTDAYDIIKNSAYRMVSQSKKYSATSMSKSLKELAGSIAIKPSETSGNLNLKIKAKVDSIIDNAKSITDDIVSDTKNTLLNAVANGVDLDTASEQIAKINNRAVSDIEKASNDFGRYVNTAINEDRMKKAGVTKFMWLHSAGGKVPRPLHIDELNGNIYSLDDPPIIDEKTGIRGLPGTIYNCRCVMVPIIEFDEPEEEEE